jgi:hypothetical protein
MLDSLVARSKASYAINPAEILAIVPEMPSMAWRRRLFYGQEEKKGVKERKIQRRKNAEGGPEGEQINEEDPEFDEEDEDQRRYEDGEYDEDEEGYQFEGRDGDEDGNYEEGSD